MLVWDKAVTRGLSLSSPASVFAATAALLLLSAASTRLFSLLRLHGLSADAYRDPLRPFELMRERTRSRPLLHSGCRGGDGDRVDFPATPRLSLCIGSYLSHANNRLHWYEAA